MKCKLMVFAGIREAVGSDTIEIDFHQGLTARQYKDRLVVAYPHAADLIRMSRMAVSNAFVSDDEPLVLDSSTDVALIPPVSGG